MTEKINVVCLNDSAVNDTMVLGRVMDDLRRMAGPKILVHGPRANADSSVDYLIRESAYTNFKVVAAMKANGFDGLGISSADAGIVTGISYDCGDGYSGRVNLLDVSEYTLSKLLNIPLALVFSSVYTDGAGDLLYGNPAEMALAIAGACARMAPVDLIYFVDSPMPESQTSAGYIPSVISINPDEVEKMVSESRMAKETSDALMLALQAVKVGVHEVYVKRSTDLLNPAGLIVGR